VITDLLDAVQYPAHDRLALYLARWGIERVFQQLTEVFHLQALMGTTPQGTGFHLAFGLQVYNLLQGVRASVATAPARPPEPLATELLFADVQRHLVALTELLPPPAVTPLFDPFPSHECLCTHLCRLLETVWTPRGLKAPAKKPKAPTARAAIHGKQTSVYRLLTAHRQKQQAVTSPPQ
jgi:hypothetical protein